MKKSILFAICFLVIRALFAQPANIPVEPRNPDEIVTLSRETTFDQAIQILNSFAREYEQRIIINRTSFQQPIGVNIPAMPWQQALRYITAANGLILEEKKDYYEILPQTPEQAASKSSASRQSFYGTDSKEIRISATFFEGQRRLLREIGVDWSTLNNGKVSIASQGAQNVSSPMFEVGIPSLNPGDLARIAGTGWDIRALFSTFEAANKGEILSSPTIKVLDGETGRIQVGQDFSINQVDFAGNTVTQFFSTGTILDVTPEVVEINDTTFIHMDISAEKSSAQPDPVSTIINKQQASTQILLLSGEETLIAGLYRNEESSVRRGIPYLKNLPWWFFGLRFLFGYDSKDSIEQELVILIKAELIPSISERYSDKSKP
ncbi:MAG: type II and III secretion system protein [Candidatus Marinimicrobia bacterium]|nr:type II and III secretion system protein [Candidatus Neomarinimicrobiota bacterium]MCF7880564.1 type II and III secretion system protein [Candidatus Neomarinimicrobiota bacterium]